MYDFVNKNTDCVVDCYGTIMFIVCIGCSHDINSVKLNFGICSLCIYLAFKLLQLGACNSVACSMSLKALMVKGH